MPPSDQEKYSYLRTSQHHWVFWFSALAMAGVAVSWIGLATQSYWTLPLLLPLVLLVAEQLMSLRTSTFRRPRQPILAVVLIAGTVAATGYQIWMGEAVSLHKHLTLGIIFGAPLAGVLLSALVRAARRISILLVVGACYLALVTGLIQSEKLFQVWPNTTALHGTVEFAVDSMPWIRSLVEVPEPLTYSLAGKTAPWQWTATYDGSFTYVDPGVPNHTNLQGLEAYQHALQDNYFQLVILDGSTGIGQQLAPEAFGFTQTDTVTDAASGHTWRIYQRFDHIPK